MDNSLTCPWRQVPERAWFAALGVGCLGLVAFGMALQFQLRLAPCPMCIFQRFLYVLIGLLALSVWAAPLLGRVFAGLIGFLALGGVGVAGYQTWMQAFPELAQECSYSNPNILERFVDWLGMQWPSWFMATGFCTSREWEMLGLSMANWSVLIYVGIVAYVWLVSRCKN